MSDRQELDSVIAAIVTYTIPRSIVLFGSRAKNTASSESDFDLCVIYDQLPKRKLEVLQDLYRSLFPLSVHAVDLLVYQSDRFEARSARKGTIEAAIRAEGQVVYG
jgi:predicted nucleotidyltransferase